LRSSTGKVDIRLPGKENPHLLGARQVHQIVSMIKWIRTSRSSMTISLSLSPKVLCVAQETREVDIRLPGNGYSKSCGARPVYQIISMMDK
jgi:hypothetical protein